MSTEERKKSANRHAIIKKRSDWACSVTAIAPPWHGGDYGFESRQVHPKLCSIPEMEREG